MVTEFFFSISPLYCSSRYFIWETFRSFFDSHIVDIELQLFRAGICLSIAIHDLLCRSKQSNGSRVDIE